MKCRRNSDDRYRNLERAAKAGDPDALVNLAREKVRVGEEDEEFLARVEAMHAILLDKLPTYNEEAVRHELLSRIALLQSYVLEDEDMRTEGNKYSNEPILDLITIESASDSAEFLSHDHGGDSYNLVAMAGGAHEAFSYNDASMSQDIELHFGIAPAPLTRAEVDFLWNKVGAIVRFADSGFRYVSYFDTEEELTAAWVELEEEYYPAEEEIDEGDEANFTEDGTPLYD